MRKALSILLVLFIIVTFVACDSGPETPKDEDQTPSGQGDEGGSGSQGSGENQPPKATYTVTFVQEGVDNVVKTYTEGDPLWLYAPDLPFHNVLGYYYNWDTELDSKVNSDMTVNRIEGEGNVVFFLNVDNHAIKIIERKSSGGWSDIKVSEFPAVPEFEGYEGCWNQTGDIGYFSSSRQDITCWYFSTETYGSTGMPKSFIVPSTNGALTFALSEYPIKVTGNDLKFVNKTEFPSAADGLTQITESDCAAVISFLGNDTLKTQFEDNSFNDATDMLVANEDTSNLGFVNAIKVMRQKTSDNTWSIPRGAESQYVLKKLIELGIGETFYSYLSAGSSSVNCINSDSFFISNGKKRMVYSYISGGEPVWAQYLFGSTFNGYLWPIKPIEQR